MCPPPLVSEDRGPHLGAQQASWAQVDRVNAILFSLAPSVWEGPSCLPLLISPASLLCPQNQCGRRGRGGLGGEGTRLRAQQAPRARVGGAIALCSSPAPPGWALPPASPDPTGLPPMPPGPVWPGWGFGGGIPAWELSRLPRLSGPGYHPLLLSRSFRRVPPTFLS